MFGRRKKEISALRLEVIGLHQLVMGLKAVNVVDLQNQINALWKELSRKTDRQERKEKRSR